MFKTPKLFKWISWKIKDIQHERQIDKALEALHREAQKPYHEICGSVLVTDYLDNEGFCKECKEFIPIW